MIVQSNISFYLIYFSEHMKSLSLSSCREHSLLTLDPTESKQPVPRWYPGCLLRRNPDTEEAQSGAWE